MEQQDTSTEPAKEIFLSPQEGETTKAFIKRAWQEAARHPPGTRITSAYHFDLGLNPKDSYQTRVADIGPDRRTL